MRTRSVGFVVLSFSFIICGCSQPTDTDIGSAGSTVTPPRAPTPGTPQTAQTPNWKGDATVVAVARGSTTPCGWGTSVGDTRNGVQWRITVTADQISLDQDTPNWPTDDLPYSGHLAGAQFTATYKSDSNYAAFVCQFREASIFGTFTSDSTFVADETLIWGTPGLETSVKRRWSGSRL